MKATAVAPSNIAFIKYWGKKDESLRLPANGSISVNLSNLLTTTTVFFDKNLKNDTVIINGKRDKNREIRVSNHLDRIRKVAKISTKATVISKNNFPTSGGLASSASGFAALTVAGTKAAGLNLSEKELSALSRLGSGSACRSIPDGFAEWLEGDSNESSYAVSIFPQDFWKLAIIIALAEDEEKPVLTSEGMKSAFTSQFYSTRLEKINEKIKKIKVYMKEKKFEEFGEITELETLEMHSIALTSDPSIIYWQPKTIKVMKLIQEIRKKEFPVYFTIDAGPHVCIICEEKNLKKLLIRLKSNSINKIIVNKPSKGARLISDHLF